MNEPGGHTTKRNWNVTGRELSTWRLILLVFPPPLALMINEAFGLVPAIVVGALLYLGVIWFVITVPKKDRVIQNDEHEDV